MQPEKPESVLVNVSTPEARFAFRVEIPTTWAQLPVPQEQVDFSNEGLSQPIAAFVAKYGAVVLTFSARPGFAEGSVAEWLRRICTADKVQIGQFAPAQAGGIPAVGASGSQASEAGPMSLRVLAFEQGGWLHLLMAMAPAAIWDSVTPTFDRMLASFAMTNPMPATVPLWPPGDEPTGAAVPASGPNLSLARQVADQFLQAVQRGDKAAAKALLVAHEGESLNFGSMSESALSYTLGQPQAEGANVVVEARLRAAASGPAEPGVQVLPIVLCQVGDQWKVDMSATLSQMLGVNLDDAITGLGSAMAKGMVSLGEGLKAAFSSSGGGTNGLDEAVKYVRETVLAEAEAKMAERLDKPIYVDIDWFSFRQNVAALRRLGQLALGTVVDAIQVMTEYGEEQEKLKGMLNRVRIRHVDGPDQQVCRLTGGVLELAVCLVDPSGGNEPAGGPDLEDIIRVVRQGIGQT